MAESNSDKILILCFMKQIQHILVLLLKENRYPQYLKLFAIVKDTKKMMEKFLENSIVTGSERTLNTDAKSTFSLVEEKINLKSDNWYLSWNI